MTVSSFQRKKQILKVKSLDFEGITKFANWRFCYPRRLWNWAFAGLDRVAVGDSEQEAIRLIYKDNDVLMFSIHSLHKIASIQARREDHQRCQNWVRRNGTTRNQK